MPKSGLHRDPRVDFFRGLAFIIILIAHIPSNWMARWIPARFGPSDATEMFVFMSGYAAGIAFGTSFMRAGYWLGTARVGLRVWQVYLAHLTLFFFVATFMVVANELFDTRDYVGQLNLWYFFNNTGQALIGLFTMNYVPNYFDILPMYIIVLVMMPVVVGLSRVHPWLGPAACVLLYVCTWTFGLEFKAEVRPDSDRPWFFNPFGWHLIFFTGFSLSMGWIKPPPKNWWLFGACVALVVLGLVTSHRPIYADSETLIAIREWLAPWRAKTDFGIWRYIHFLALAYVVVVLLKGYEESLRSPWGAPIMKCGQQSLPVFLFAMVLSRFAGIALDHTGREIPAVILVNVVFIGLLIAIAYGLGWLKSNPWQASRFKPPTAEPDRPLAGPAPARAAE